jgi:osmotically-inducible protein OsmY
MNKQGCYLLLLLSCTGLLSACLGGLWTGASLIYTRNSVYKKINEQKLNAEAHRLLFQDGWFKQEGCSVELAVFNGDILVVGHVPSVKLRDLATSRLKTLHGYRRLLNQLAIAHFVNNGLQDSWITTQILSQMVADNQIDPASFKILTADAIVYVMGDVKPADASRVLDYARNTVSVKRVVKVLNYYHLSNRP